MLYELIIETNQPPCGGKPPKLYEFKTIFTDDPLTYVQNLHPDSALSRKDENGEITITVGEGLKQIKYCFTED